MAGRIKGLGKVGRARHDPAKQERVRQNRWRQLKRVASGFVSGPRRTTKPKASPLLDGLYPPHQNKWIENSKRKLIANIELSDFSFIDHPNKTLRLLRELVIADTTARRIKINFRDLACLDVAPYLLMTLVGDELGAQGNIVGGAYTDRVRQVLEATKIAERFHMKPVSPTTTPEVVWPMEIKSCRHTHSASRLDYTGQQATVADEFVRTIESWINQAGVGLTDDGRDNLLKMISEVLDNGTLHSKPVTNDGEAWLAGFMTKHPDAADGCYVCHLSIITIGASIYESMQTCSKRIRAEIEELVTRHTRQFIKRAHWTREGLWTLYAFQDGVTRLSDAGDPTGGYGLMELLQFFARLGRSDEPGNQPAMCVISGRSCIVITGEPPIQGVYGQRRMALNSENDLQKPPSRHHF